MKDNEFTTTPLSRMIAEFIELRYRIEKLETALQWHVPEEERFRMMDQLDLMYAYSRTLCDRMYCYGFNALTFLVDTATKWKEHKHD